MTNRLARKGTVLAIIVVLVIAGIFAYKRITREGTHFSAMFAHAVGIYSGSDVRMLGVRVGTVDSVTPVGAEVRVRMHLDDGVRVAAGTEAVILSPSLVSDRYVQLTGLYTSGPRLASGAVIPVSRTATPVELDQLYSSVTALSTALGPKGANSDGALTTLLNTAAANLKGNGAAINSAISGVSKASSTLANAKDGLFSTVDNLSSFTSVLAKSNSQLVGLNEKLASVSQVLADDRQTFAAALTQLSSALNQVQSFIKSNRAALKSNVSKLATITQTLVTERASLALALKAAPLTVDNLLNAYDPAHKTLDGRADLNELTLWSSANSSLQTATRPLLLPDTGAGS